MDASLANQSNTDFAIETPSPRPNSVAPTEQACGGGGGPGGGGTADTKAPETTIGKQPTSKSAKKKARFKFSADEQGAKFECKLDKGRVQALLLAVQGQGQARQAPLRGPCNR